MKIGERRLTEEQILEILDSDLPAHKLGPRYGMSPQGIRGIWTGAIYKDIAPDVERRKTGLKCTNCLHYDGEYDRHKHTHQHSCSFGFPEIKTSLGIRSANSCNHYLHCPQ